MAHKTLTELFELRVAEFGDAPALRYCAGSDINSLSWADWLRLSTLFAAGMLSLGLGEGQRVGILSRTRWEWPVIDQAIMMAGASTVGIFEHSRAKQCQLIASDAGITLLFVEDPCQLERVLSVWPAIPSLRAVVLLDELATESTVARGGSRRLEDVSIPAQFAGSIYSLARLRELGAQAIGSDPNIVSRARRSVGGGSLASIVYTTGTTGRPRGVMLTHENFLAAIEAFSGALHPSRGDEHLLILPLAQILARVMYLNAVSAGAVTSISRGIEFVHEDFRKFRPHVFAGVPRIFEKMHEESSAKFVNENKLLKKVADRALWLASVANQDDDDESLNRWRRLELAALSRIVGNDLRKSFGGRVRFAITAASPISGDLSAWYNASGVPLFQGYGLTESCAAGSIERVGARRAGTAGKPLNGVEIRLSDEGEILIRGKNVMPGYWNAPAETTSSLRDGWLHSGDLGALDDGFLRVLDRKRDVIYLGNGQAVAPATLEDMLCEIPWVMHAVVHGDNREYLSAVLTLNTSALQQWADENGMREVSIQELVHHSSVFELIDSAIRDINKELSAAEQIRKFAILPTAFSTETGELTHALQTRRKFVTEKHRAVLDSLYEK